MCETGAKVAIFYRDGEAAGLIPASRIKSGGATVSRRVACWRCGGAGGSDAWKHTGWKCYRCGGAGSETRQVRAFTADKLDALKARAAKAADKRAKLAAAKAEADRAAAVARRAGFEREHGGLIESARAYVERSDFVASMVAQADSLAWLTDAQRGALESTVAKFKAGDEAKAKRKANARHIGQPGERVELRGLTVRNVAAYPSQYGQYCIVAMETADGQSVVYKGSRTYGLERGDVLDMVATVKAHDSYRDMPQTVLSRPKVANVEHADDCDA